LIHLSKRGITILKADERAIRKHIAGYALDVPKIADAYVALVSSRKVGAQTFSELMAPMLEGIVSSSYKTLTKNILKSWAKFIASELKN
jgi:hypothetical protein